MLSVLQYAVEVLDVRHVIVCGHYECGGVKAAAQKEAHFGLVDNWLCEIRTIERMHGQELDALATSKARLNRLGELSVIHQVLQPHADARDAAGLGAGPAPAAARPHLLPAEWPAQGTGARAIDSSEEADALQRTLYGA